MWKKLCWKIFGWQKFLFLSPIIQQVAHLGSCTSLSNSTLKNPFYWVETLSRTRDIWRGWPADGERGKGGVNRKIGQGEGRREEKNGCIRHPCATVPMDKSVLVYIWLIPLDCAPPSPLCCPLPANLDSGTPLLLHMLKLDPVPSV